MADYSSISRAITSRFKGVWEPDVWTQENYEFDAPKDALWARLVLRYNAGGQYTLAGTGSRKFRRSGQMLAMIFTPINEKTGAAIDAAQRIVNAFEGTRLDGTSLIFHGSELRMIGPDPHGPWFHANCYVDFEYFVEK